MNSCDGVVYKITDIDTGEFYIGQTQRHRWLDGYPGSGRYWKEHCKEFPDHRYKREVLYENITNFNELFELEITEIRKFCVFDEENNKWIKTNSKMLNDKLSIHPDRYICSECGHSPHLKTCSKYKEPDPCAECGGLFGKHYKTCLYYTPYPVCEECGSTHSHKKWCSHYKTPKSCTECGVIKGHKKTCSHYTSKEPCSECRSTSSRHKKTCSQYSLKENKCLECGGINGQHKSNCSKRKVCSICGSTPHKSNCPVAPRCPECGALTGHFKTCSKSYTCPECEGKNHKHYKSCSHYNIQSCSECGGKHGKHYKSCSRYKYHSF